MTDWIGWTASILLLLTLGSQIVKQWRSGAIAGVSPFLFVGQLIASVLFTAYSVFQGDAVFIAVNAAMVLNGLLGLIVDRRNRRSASSANQAAGPDRACG